MSICKECSKPIEPKRLELLPKADRCFTCKTAFEDRCNWVIKDWAGNTCFKGQKFESFDDAEEFLCEKLNEDYELDRGDYELTEVKKS